LFALQKADNWEVISLPTAGGNPYSLLDKEWLLTNKRGGFASSTVVGCNTRRYHGLLIGSLTPPVNRIMALSGCIEKVRTANKEFNLSGFEFEGLFSPEFIVPSDFRQDVGVHFNYRIDGLELTKSVYLLGHEDTVGVVYDFNRIDGQVIFEVRPFAALRDFHSLQKSRAVFNLDLIDGLLSVQSSSVRNCELILGSGEMEFREDKQWWYNILYRQEIERGQECLEDLWTPGVFRCVLEQPRRIVLWASLRDTFSDEQRNRPYFLNNYAIDAVCEELFRSQSEINPVRNSITGKNMILKEEMSNGVKDKPKAAVKDEVFTRLCLAADQYIVKRFVNEQQHWTILAGFPWFGEWGRDVFLSLPGLLLSTGRLEEARSILMTFAEAADCGMIPNFFDEYNGSPQFNSIDSSLWFIHSAFQYLKASGDTETFSQHLLPVIRWIVDCYQLGTRFGIHCDEDGLITGGNKDTQLTWMDAKFGEESFTPRFGKAVEVNALWYNSLCYLAQYYSGESCEAGIQRNTNVGRGYRFMADRSGESFRRLFWNEITGYLNDCIGPDGRIDASLRPNQIFAVSLPFSPLDDYQERCVVDVVQQRLLTPFGLRTLDVYDRRYQGQYCGSWRQRDQAYHQGTVWPYLAGPFVEAFLKVNNFSAESKIQAAGFIEPLLQHFINDGCLGQVSEIFDGDKPHRPRGCFAQAWSVAELIRAYLLINS